jgi:hypothetical protein
MSSTCDEWIDDRYVREAPEVTIGRPQFAYTMLAAKSRDPGIVHQWTCHAAGKEQGTQSRPMNRRFCKQEQSWRFQPDVYLLERPMKGCWRYIDSWMRHDVQEFVKARPGNGPGSRPLRQPDNAGRRGPMERQLRPMCVNENIGVDGDQLPLSS